MDTDLIKAGPERIAEYLSFLINFAANPRDVLQPYAGKSSIDGKLLSFSVFGVSLCYVILLIAHALGAAQDNSVIVSTVGAIPLWACPLVAVLLIILATLIFHVVATRLVPLWAEYKLRSTGVPTSPHLGGTVWNSLNAALGFGAFFLPLMFVGYAVILVAVGQSDLPNSWLLFLGVIAVICIAFFFYFPAALAATHPNTTFWQAGGSLMYAITLLVLLRLIVEKIASFWPDGE